MSTYGTRYQTRYETSATPATGAPLRSRTHTWQPRPEMTPEILGTSGLEVLRASLEGELPGASMMSTLGFRLTEAAEGVAVFEGDPGDHLLNPMGTVHGGFLATCSTRRSTRP
ncbi:PaaI family thioesterase [Streptomyces erythrochromogenes]|uniref:PaaI family thioesterase n=1 Tax=Streptomyces erythrochromogenes TaxID=285574 RepID=UPI0037F52FDC